MLVRERDEWPYSSHIERPRDYTIVHEKVRVERPHQDLNTLTKNQGYI